MNFFIETLNQWGENFLSFAWPMLWQSSLLITALFVFDLLFRRRLRASIRYALWLVVLVKLCVPPTLALPTSPAWWLHQTPPIAAKPETHYTVTYDNAPLPEIPPSSLPVFVPPKPAMNLAGWLLVVSVAVSSALLGWLLVRWWQITRQIHRAKICERLATLAAETQQMAGMKSKFQVKLTTNSMSPAVCGLFRPVILIPQPLAGNFSDEQLRAVLLHELIHLRRCDVWLNFLQALLQIVYWWHPLVWLANARLRRVREEAVDDAVMLALHDRAEAYAPTLLEVAKLALNRPLVSLGLVGIMESRSALRQRIERLVDFRTPRQAGLTLVSLLGILAFTAVAVPMGQGPSPAENPSAIATNSVEDQSLTVKVDPEIFIQNVKAQAAKVMLSPTNDYGTILDDVLRTEGVDLVPPHGIAFNTRTGEITIQNTPDKLELFRQVVEQLNRADGKCELPLRNNVHRKNVLIEARIYQMPAADFDKFTSGLDYQSGRGGDPWWSVAPEKFQEFIGKLESSGLPLMQRPRIQTGSGMPAQFFVGNETNSLEFDCKPFAADGFIDLTLQGSVISRVPANGTFTNHFGTKAAAENHGGIVIRMENFNGHADSNLVAVIGVEIVTNSVHFQQRLQAIIKRADMSFPTSANTTNVLFNRVFAVDPHTFVASLKQAGVDVGGITNSAEQIVPAIRNFFARLGVDMNSPPGKAVFYKDRTGRLFVRATENDLDIVERAIEFLNSVPPQIHIKARFLEVPEGTVASFGNYLNTTNSTNNQFTGILNATNLKLILHSLESRKDVETLAEPEVTTTSGRQTQMRATQVITVVTNFAFQESLTNNGTSSIFPQTSTVETGPILDVVPYVLADGYTINLTIIPSLTEFLGYATPPDVPNVTGTNNRVQLPVVLPQFSTRQMTASLNLSDNQTVIVGGMIETKYVTDKVPVLGSVPLMGRLFQTKKTTQNEILILISATIVDPAGNRVHSDDEQAPAKQGVPVHAREEMMF